MLGQNAVERIKNNPYILANQVEGISFKTADNIAFVRGIPKDDPERVKAGIQYMLSNAAYASGHTYLPKDLLLEHAAYNLTVPEEIVQNGIDALALEKDVYLDTIDGKEVCYLSAFLSAELYIARRISSMAACEQQFTMTE